MSTYVVRLQNLPLKAQSYHVRNFFKGLIIPAGGVRIIGGPEGVAFILFSSKEDVQTAMSFNGGLLCSAHVKLAVSCHSDMNKVLYPISDSEHYTVTPCQSPLYESTTKHNPEHLKYVECIFPTGLLIESDFVTLFHPRVIELIKIFSGPDSTCESAIIKFSKLHDKNAALMRDGCYIRDCRVRILIPSEKYCEAVEMEVLQNYCDVPPKNSQKDYCLEILGISGAADYNSLGHFLGLPMFFKTKRLFIEMQEGMCKGRAYVDFETNHFEFNKALKKHNSIFFSAPLQIQPVSMQQLVEVLNTNKEFINEENFIKQAERSKPLHPTPIMSYQNNVLKTNESNNSCDVQKHTSNTEGEKQIATASTNGTETEEKCAEVGKETGSQTSESVDDSKQCSGDETAKKISVDSENPPVSKVENSNKEIAHSAKPKEVEGPAKLNPKKFCVRMANVSYQATEQAIQCFLKGIFIPVSSIVFLKKGSVKLGHVFIRLYSAEEAQKAEQYHMKNFFGRTVTVKASYVYFLRNLWDKEVGSGFPEHIFNESQLSVGKPTIASFHMDIEKFGISCVHASNLPSDCNEQDLYNILTRDHGITLKRVHIMKGNFGRCLGNCFIELNSQVDCHRTVELHEKIKFFDRLLDFFPIKFQDMQMKIIMPPPPQVVLPPQVIPPPHQLIPAPLYQPPVVTSYADHSKRARFNTQFIPYPPKPAIPQDSSTVKMSGLSPSATQEDILNFFQDYQPVVGSVKLVKYEADGGLNGEGVIEMGTPQLARSAVDALNNRELLTKSIKLEIK